MKHTTKLFRGKKVRAAWDSTNKKWWLSAVDICAVLRGCSYDCARNYWKQLKHRLSLKLSRLIRTVHQLKMLAKDGKMRYTDVMDYKKVIQLIQSLPCETAEVFKAWIGGIAAKHCDLTGQLELDGDRVLKGDVGLRRCRMRVLI